MMVEPNMDVLLAHVDSKYTLVSVSSKRARKIMEKAENSMENPVTNALEEIAAGKVFWERPEETAEADKIVGYSEMSDIIEIPEIADEIEISMTEEASEEAADE